MYEKKKKRFNALQIRGMITGLKAIKSSNVTKVSFKIKTNSDAVIRFISIAAEQQHIRAM